MQSLFRAGETDRKTTDQILGQVEKNLVNKNFGSTQKRPLDEWLDWG